MKTKKFYYVCVLIDLATDLATAIGTCGGKHVAVVVDHSDGDDDVVVVLHFTQSRVTRCSKRTVSGKLTIGKQ